MDAWDRQALIDIRDVLDRALGYPIDTAETFQEKEYLQDAVIRCLEVIGEASKRLSLGTRRLHPEVPWRAMAGIRDILIHAYDRVDLEEAWMAYQRLPEIRKQINEIFIHCFQKQTLFRSIKQSPVHAQAAG